MVTATMDTDQTRAKRVELIIRQLDSLPTLPVVATRLLKATTAERSSLKEIVSLIESDQSLTAKILTLTRRAHLGLGNSVTTVEKAVVMMGLDAVRNAILSIQVFETFGPKGSRDEGDFDRLEFWKHSLAVACGAQLIAEQLPKSLLLDPDEAFVCGLLHDLGKVVLDNCLPKSFARVVKIAETNRSSIADVERRVLGIDHAAIGKKLADQWQLPEKVSNAIWLHHHKSSQLPEHIGHRTLIDVMYLADLIAREQRIGFSGNFILVDRSIDLAGQLDIDENAYQKILLELRKRMSQRAELIGLDQLNTDDLYLQALRVANTELGRLNESMTGKNHKLKSRARYFDAINELHHWLRPGMATAEMIEHIARAIRSGLALPAVIVYRQDEKNRFLEAAFIHKETTATQLFELPIRSEPLPDLSTNSLLLDPPEYLEPVITRHAKKLGTDAIKLIRLTGADCEIGGVLFSCPKTVATRLINERQEIEALATACSLALGQSMVIEAKERLADDLLVANRQMQELEQKLLESRCLAALGELAAGAAHEMNNPLAIMSGRAQLLRDQEEHEEKRKSLEIIIDQANNASGIISELMEFAKPVKPQRELINLKDHLESTITDFVGASELNRDQIMVDIEEGAGVVLADRQQLDMIVKELLDNAVEAADDVNLQVKINAVVEDDSRYVQLRVADNGPGMEPEVLNKALDLFYSSRKAGRRRGVGLSRVYRYVQANDGMFWLESQPGMGTTAYIRLPSRPTADSSKEAAET